MSSRAEIKAAITGDSSKFRGAVNECGVAVNQFKENTLKTVAGAVAGAFTIHAIKSFATEAMRTADEIDDLSKKLKLSATTVQLLQDRCDDSGIAFDKLQGAILKMTQAQTKANSGNQSMIESFRAIGITQNDLKGTSEEVFSKMITLMAENADSAELMSETYSILGGKSAGELKDMLIELGRDGIANATQELDKMGQLIDTETIRILDDMEQKIKDAGDEAKTFGMKILAGVIDSIQRTGAAIGHLSAGDIKGMTAALAKADYWTSEYSSENKKAAAATADYEEAVSDARAETEAMNKTMAAGAEKTDASKERITELLGEIDSLNDQLKEAKQTEVTFNIQHMSRSELEVWQDFFKNFQGTDTDYKVDVSLQHITQHQLDMWEKFLTMVRYADTKIDIRVELENLTNHKLSMYEKLFALLKGAPSYEIRIAKLDASQIRYYEQLMNVMGGAKAFELKLPDQWAKGVPVNVTEINMPLGAIAEHLSRIAAWGGVPYA